MAAAISTSATGANNTDRSPIPVSVPSGLASGDLWVILMSWDVNGGDTVTTPSGWADLQSQMPTNDWPVLVAFWKVAGASETTVNVSGSNINLWYRIWASLRITGANTTTPLDVASTLVSQSGSDNYDPASVTVAANGSLALGMCSLQSGATCQDPSGSTSLINHNGDYPCTSIVYQAVDAGTFNPSPFTHPAGGGAGGSAFWIVVAPAAGGGSPGPALWPVHRNGYW